MLIGLLGDVLLVAGVSAYALTLLHLIARDVQRVRWRREFDGWRVLQRDRIARHRMALSLAGHVECRSGWIGLQRQRLARRRCDRASW